MFKKISILMLVIALAFMFACTTPYVKNISEPTTPTIAPPETIEIKTAVVKGTVLFAFDSFELDIVEKYTLEQIATEMKNAPGIVLILRGHTDKVGSYEYNQLLSEDRVDAVEDYLYEAGVSEDQIFSIQAFGETMLLPELSDRENRRVTILLIEL